MDKHYTLPREWMPSSLKIVEEVFEQIRDTPYSQVAENRIRQESNLQKTKRAAVEKKIKAAQHAWNALRVRY